MNHEEHLRLGVTAGVGAGVCSTLLSGDITLAVPLTVVGIMGGLFPDTDLRESTSRSVHEQLMAIYATVAVLWSAFNGWTNTVPMALALTLYGAVSLTAERMAHRTDTHNLLVGVPLALTLGCTLPLGGAAVPVIAGTWLLAFLIHLAADDMQSGVNSQVKQLKRRRTRMADPVLRIRMPDYVGVWVTLTVGCGIILLTYFSR